MRDLNDFRRKLAWDAEQLPLADRYAPRLTKPGEMDLTAARLFVIKEEYHTQLIALLRKHLGSITIPWEAGRDVLAHVAVGLLLKGLHVIHTLWCQKTLLTNEDLALYDRHLGNVRKAWNAFKWKVSPWVHWLLAHSSIFVHKYRNMFVFSSIPSEMRHKPFKMDVRHTFLGGKRTLPARCARGLTNLMKLDAVDKSIQLRRAIGTLPPAKRRRIGR